MDLNIPTQPRKHAAVVRFFGVSEFGRIFDEMAPRSKLPENVRLYMVTSLACFDPPSAVVASVHDQFGIVVTRQLCETYDPTKTAGAGLARKWTELFHTTRQKWLDGLASEPSAYRAFRVRRLAGMASKLEEKENFLAAAKIYKQIAMEVGGVFRRQEASFGPHGVAPLPPTPAMSADQLKRFRTELYESVREQPPKSDDPR